MHNLYFIQTKLNEFNLTREQNKATDSGYTDYSVERLLHLFASKLFLTNYGIIEKLAIKIRKGKV